eukprot:NODE_2626_length_495_cov_109.724215_g2089_i0.p1 GENE.NODE_2626_length_495_cov_109.724215_g2089_i0~~NODE_2626_length_495_cov_109.724215_g2089_i0.p1  ORF type:complete len:132 (-),score=33.99 NODE_2626_length_495_cov_109.724215_g2089_i0:98-442(-)
MPNVSVEDPVYCGFSSGPGLTYFAFCLAGAPFFMICEGMYRARFHRKNRPAGKIIAMTGLKIRVFPNRPVAPKVIRKPVYLQEINQLKTIQNRAAALRDEMALTKKISFLQASR